MRIKAQDLDIDMDNWEAVFEIVQGNEDGYFSIKTDPVTNEGILFLEKVSYIFYPEDKQLRPKLFTTLRN